MRSARGRCSAGAVRHAERRQSRDRSLRGSATLPESWYWWPYSYSFARSFGGTDLINPPLVPPAFEAGVQPQRDDLISKAGGDDAAAHRENVGVVVLAGEPGGIE